CAVYSYGSSYWYFDVW
nr:immunoglobulin heavy chain junction region [Mus musculus]